MLLRVILSGGVWNGFLLRMAENEHQMQGLQRS